MKKLLLIVFLGISLTGISQTPILRLSPNVVSTDINGGSIEKGDTIQVSLLYTKGAPNLMSFYLDFQHQITAINMIDIVFGNAAPSGSQTTFQNAYYPGYSFLRNSMNSSESGLQNYQNMQYQFQQGGSRAINRIWLNSSRVFNSGKVADIRFRVENVAAGFPYDSIYYNFAIGFDNQYGGNLNNIVMPRPNTAWPAISPTSNALINGEINLNTALLGGLKPQVIIVDSATNIVRATVTPGDNGLFTLGSELQPNTAYKAYVAVRSDSIPRILNNAITVSDYTIAATEFIKQNLDGSWTNSNIASGVGFLAADINRNRNLDGGDITALFAQAVGADTILSAVAGQSLWNVPAFLAGTYDTLTFNGFRALTDIYTVNFRTSTVARPLAIKYVIPGDINRSHSSVRVQQQGVTTFSIGSGSNTPPVQSINVNLNNVTVLSDEFTVPVNIDTKGVNLSGLQFEFVYDESKVKFESIRADMPVWLIFVNNTPGRIKFGAIDREMKTPYSGSNLTPFRLVFKTLQNGLDIKSTIKVTTNMDAADAKGNQVHINLNSTNIRLTGYNNF